jgi:hypothetical protein
MQDDHRRLRRLEDAIGMAHGNLPILGERDGCLFTQVDGVTVLVGPRGRLVAPAIRSYDEPLDVTSVARLFQAQQKRDRAVNPTLWRTGHLGPIVGTEWICNRGDCPCHREEYERRMQRSFGFPLGRLGESIQPSNCKRSAEITLATPAASTPRTTEVPSFFLKAMGVRDAEQALKESLLSALGHNPTYSREEQGDDRVLFRAGWARLIRAESQRYTEPIGDEAHCQIISDISDALSLEFGDILLDRQLRFGTSQKAFNLYLKYLWQLERRAVPPPHCPVDRIMLELVGIKAAWTQCNSVAEYMSWIHRLRAKAEPLPLAIWENEIWYEEWKKNNS